MSLENSIEKEAAFKTDVKFLCKTSSLPLNSSKAVMMCELSVYVSVGYPFIEP